MSTAKVQKIINDSGVGMFIPASTRQKKLKYHSCLLKVILPLL